MAEEGESDALHGHLRLETQRPVIAHVKEGAHDGDEVDIPRGGEGVVVVESEVVVDMGGDDARA